MKNVMTQSDAQAMLEDVMNPRDKDDELSEETEIDVRHLEGEAGRVVELAKKKNWKPALGFEVAGGIVVHFNTPDLTVRMNKKQLKDFSTTILQLTSFKSIRWVEMKKSSVSIGM